MLSVNNQMADKNIKMIHQFLLDHKFDSTAETLIQEASKMGFQNLEYKLRDITDQYAQLILCYNTGNYSTFFQLWSELFSDSIKQHEEYKKLTFYLHVYFAILPICELYRHEYKEYELTRSEINRLKSSSRKEDSAFEMCKKNNTTEIEKNINNSMKQLQDYLSGDGKEFEHDTELQPFYALPFIEDLHANTFFSKVLEQYWLDELSKNLNLFIANHKQDLFNLNDVSCDKARLPNIAQAPTTLPTIKTKTIDSPVVAQDKTTKKNMLIVANDRDIPILLGNNDNEKYYSCCHKINRDLKSNGTQTHITGDEITINNSQGGRMDREEDIDRFSRMHKQDRKLIQHKQEFALTKSHSRIHTNYEKLKLRFHKLHADYHKLIDVAGELTVALENSVKGQAVDIQRTLEICMKIFPDLFNQNIRETSYTSLPQHAYGDLKMTVPKFDVTMLPVPAKLLDFKKIKLHLLSGDVKTKLLLLQALRWKITLTQSTEQDEILHEYISHDLLGLHGQIASDTGKSVLPSLLGAGEAYARHLLQQFIARLLNALASFRCGRDYLSVGCTIVNVTFACLDNNYVEGIDPFACDMLVAMLQKLSLRRQQRIYMIESGLLEWLINHLHEKCRVMNLYRLEYATALLMNLSLHRLAQARVSKISSLLVSTLLVLLSIDHAASLPYINGALNNFLNNPVIYEEAKKMKRLNMSDYVGHNHKIAEIRKHLDHILKMQRREVINTPQNEETADDDNEELNVLENELDENDPLKNYIGELNGETLLAMCYSVSSGISEDVITIDTTLQKISALSSVEFYNNQPNNHLCTGRPLHSILSTEMEKSVSPKESYIEQEITTDVANEMNFSANKVQSIAKDFSGIESPSIMSRESRIDEIQNGNSAFLEDVFWPLNEIDKKSDNFYHFHYDNHVSKEINPKVEANNVPEDELKLRRSENKTDVGLLRDENFIGANLEKFSTKETKSFKWDLSRRNILNDTIYLYENQSPKDSSETVMTSSLALISSRENDETAEMEKLSSIASLNVNNYDSNIVKDTPWRSDLDFAKEEEAFLAKPKILRTPP